MIVDEKNRIKKGAAGPAAVCSCGACMAPSPNWAVPSSVRRVLHPCRAHAMGLCLIDLSLRQHVKHKAMPEIRLFTRSKQKTSLILNIARQLGIKVIVAEQNTQRTADDAALIEQITKGLKSGMLSKAETTAFVDGLGKRNK
jgi:hypothetical protein